MRQRTFVLVHGAFHGGWCWAGVTKELRAAGHEVYAPSLTGLGDRSHLTLPSVSLRTHILDIANLIRWEGLESVVLCGHSYGGMVIAGVAEELGEDAISTIIFFDAILPRDGLALIDYPTPQNDEGKGFAPDFNGGMVSPPGPAAFGLKGEYLTFVAERITPQPVGTFTEPLTLTGAYERVKIKKYILCAGEAPASYLDQCAEDARNRSGWSVTKLKAGHDAMIDKPKEVARILIQ